MKTDIAIGLIVLVACVATALSILFGGSGTSR